MSVAAAVFLHIYRLTIALEVNIFVHVLSHPVVFPTFSQVC